MSRCLASMRRIASDVVTQKKQVVLASTVDTQAISKSDAELGGRDLLSSLSKILPSSSLFEKNKRTKNLKSFRTSIGWLKPYRGAKGNFC